MENFILPVGFVYNGKDILEVPIAETGGDAEKIYTKKPSTTKINTWFGQILSTSIESIAGEKIASEFNKQEDKNIISEAIKSISFVDVGSLLIQIQRECWERVIKDQKITCTSCGNKLDADIDLCNIKVPALDEGEKPITETVVSLSKTYEINTGVEQMSEYDGFKFNRIRFRVATLGDAIKHELIGKDEIQFWRNIAFDTMKDLFYEDDEGVITEVPSGYVTKRGKSLFTKDFNSATLREIRASLQKDLPSAKYFYEEECPSCGEMTPFFASVANFFAA